jgi:hypothetical protein
MIGFQMYRFTTEVSILSWWPKLAMVGQEPEVDAIAKCSFRDLRSNPFRTSVFGLSYIYPELQNPKPQA